MAKHIGYINPALKMQTVELLKAFKRAHPVCKTPMAEAYRATPNVTEDDKARFVRAARFLGWSVARNRGNYYENGILIWQ